MCITVCVCVCVRVCIVIKTGDKTSSTYTFIWLHNNQQKKKQANKIFTVVCGET